MADDLCSRCGAPRCETMANGFYFECGSDAVNQSAGCRSSELSFYRNLLQLPPSEWGRPITAEVCRQLGLVQDRSGNGSKSWDDFDKSTVKVRFLKDSPIGVVGDGIDTAGLLALELALKRGVDSRRTESER